MTHGIVITILYLTVNHIKAGKGLKKENDTVLNCRKRCTATNETKYNFNCCHVHVGEKSEIIFGCN